MKYTIAVDFDGVLHAYTTPWIAPDVIPDPPVPGAIEWLRAMDKRFDIVILTTRARPQAVEGREDEGLVDGCAAVKGWLHEHGMAPEETADILVTCEKVPALVYIDDRAWRFTGRFPMAEEIHRARPWNKV